MKYKKFHNLKIFFRLPGMNGSNIPHHRHVSMEANAAGQDEAAWPANSLVGQAAEQRTEPPTSSPLVSVGGWRSSRPTGDDDAEDIEMMLRVPPSFAALDTEEEAVERELLAKVETVEGGQEYRPLQGRLHLRRLLTLAKPEVDP